MKNQLSKTSLRLPEDLWKRAKIRAIEEGIEAQELVARAIAAYLERGGRA